MRQKFMSKKFTKNHRLNLASRRNVKYNENMKNESKHFYTAQELADKLSFLSYKL